MVLRSPSTGPSQSPHLTRYGFYLVRLQSDMSQFTTDNKLDQPEGVRKETDLGSVLTPPGAIRDTQASDGRASSDWRGSYRRRAYRSGIFGWCGAPCGQNSGKGIWPWMMFAGKSFSVNLRLLDQTAPPATAPPAIRRRAASSALGARGGAQLLKPAGRGEQRRHERG